MMRSISRALAAPVAALLLLTSACGGGSSGENAAAPPPTGCDASSCGTLLVGLTDADGDFLSYTVDVVSLALKKADGASVEVLPARQRVDFSELVELSEFVTAATVPNGVYVEGTIRLDFTDAEVSVDIGGEPKAARIVDLSGGPVGLVDLAIRLDNRNHVLIAPGRPAFLQLDFDLAASNTVGDLTADPVPVTLNTFIVASVQPLDAREIRVRGPLVRVDQAAGTYTIDLRPFHHRTARHGELSVRTGADTAWEIDGTAYTGAEGLAALARKAPGTRTAAFGSYDSADRAFTAQRVHAGSSLEGVELDVIRGNVIARDGESLRVRGVTLVRRDGSVKFLRGDATVLVGSETKVTQDGGRGASLGIEAISVGQAIHAFGEASATDDAGRVTLDATSGRVRLHLTRLFGLVQAASAGNLVLDLHTIDRLRAAAFDFTGTGATAATDADPAHYEVVAPGLTSSRLTDGSPARVFGFVTPFGSAPPDFVGRTIVDFEDVVAQCTVGWGEQGTSAPFSSMSADALVLDAANPDLGLRHHIIIGPRRIDITSLATPVKLVPDVARHGTYAIGLAGTVEVFAEFADFQTALAEQLLSAKAVGLLATGRFDPGSGELETARVLVMLRR